MNASGPILADSSVLIEYYRPEGSQRVGERLAEAIGADRITTNGIIQTEILAFVRNERDYKSVAADFAAFHWLDLTEDDFDLACRLGFTLRGHGLTIPPTDLIIAASALRAGAAVWHLDSHFDQIAEHSELRSVRLEN